MTLTRVLLISLLISCASAALVGWVSRAPEQVRTGSPTPEEQAVAEEGFTDAQIARHAAYRGPLYLAVLLALITEVVFLMLLRGEPIARVVRWAEALPGGWPVSAALVAVAMAGGVWVVSLPLSYVRGHAIQRAWSISSQGVDGWFVDQLKGQAVALVIAAVAGAAFFACVRFQPRTWWLVGAGAFTLLTVLLVFVYPVLVAPLFNRFTPLADPALTARIQELGDEIGVDVDEVLVADASRRATTENAYVAGLGATKQLVLYDTLLEAGSDEETLFVVAHEMAHQAESHVLKSLLVNAIGLFAGFAALAWLLSRPGFLTWSGATSVADLRILPTLLLVAALGGLVTLPIQNGISRAFERRADAIAFRAIDDPAPAIGAFRRLAVSNLADLRPHPLLVWLLYGHPPVTERIEAARTD